MLVAHTIILATQEIEDQEYHSSRPAQENSLLYPISKKPNTKTGLEEWLMV
jgi:hypothetical protein